MSEMYEKNYAISVEIPSYDILEKDFDYQGMVLKDMQVLEEGCLSLFLLDKENQFFLYYPDEVEQTLIKITLPKSEKPKAYSQTKSGQKLFAYARGRLALIYDNKVLKFFNTERKTESVRITLPSDAHQVITKDQKFYLLLKNKKILVYSLDGKLMTGEPVDKKMFEVKKPILEGTVTIGAYGTDCLENVWIVNEDTQKMEHYIKALVYEDTATLEHTFNSDNEYTVWSNLYIEWDCPEGTEVNVEVNVDAKETETFSLASNMLLYNYIGRVLNVKLTLKSDKDNCLTPKVHALKVKINQKLYSDYLPAYYQKDKEVLSRYLSIFQDIMGDFENKIKNSEEMLNPLLCDEEYLEWLSTLLGTVRDYRWKEQDWRYFLVSLPELYKGLGTKQSMETAIKLYCGGLPVINDALDGQPWTFCVHLDKQYIKNKTDVEVIESIIEAFKPAHTIGLLDIGYDKKAFMVGGSALNLNTKIK